jgi:UDP-N-acetylmuramate--alanine ligase
MKYYCIGIKGSGMATLACLLSDLGYEVSGYDDVKDFKFTEKGLDARGIKIYYDGTKEIDSDTIITASKAFSEDHKEIRRIEELGFKITPYNEIIGNLTAKFRTISVCGTHGKTTTSSMISHIVDHTIGCNYFIGDGRGHANKDNNLFVIESDEYNKHFLAYHPSISVCTNIELEHTECYDGLPDIVNSFTRFLNSSSEYAVVCGDNENIRSILFNKDVTYYGEDESNDYVVKNIDVREDGTHFDIYYEESLLVSLMVPVFGRHMALNACAATIVCMNLGISLDDIKELLKVFKNAERRFQEEKVKDSIIIDDYAHHPTEIRVTLEAAKAKYPNKDIVAIFKPNTFSRTKEFTQDFAKALDIADYVYITNVDSNREKQEDYPGVNSNMILELTRNGKLLIESDITDLLTHKNNVFVFMSCASISHLKEDLISKL